MSFVHLHNHTHYSLLDGLAKPEDYIKIAREQNASALAITDHGSMYGSIDFYQKAKKADIKPIIGCEAYITAGSRFDKSGENQEGTRYYHLTLLAYNNKGYENLLTLTTKAYLEGFYYKPRMDFDLLTEYHEGLICLSGCLLGEIPRTIINGNEDKALELIKKYKKVFGSENFFLEIQDHPEASNQILVNRMFKELSVATNTPLVVTNDCHYAKKEDSEAHDVLICIQTQKTIYAENRLRYEGNYSMRDPKELQDAFKDVPQALKNTVEIADRCNVEIKFGQNLLPAFKPPDNKKSHLYLRELCEKGLEERYGKTPDKEVKERLDYELKMIHKMGFDTYFLIVHDFVSYAKKKEIVVGPGRGSAAGSIVSYCLAITDIDPLQYNLFFERFLNPERVTMPDIDIDFADNRRDEVLQYVTEKYGQEKVAQIITFGTMAARAAVRDTGRALGFSYSDVDRIAKLVPPPVQGRHIPLQISVKEDPDLRFVYENEEDAKQILDTAMKLEGTIRQASTHACAVVIAEEPLVNYTPLQLPPGGGGNGIVTQYSMKPIEDIGLLKMDFLGLKNLTIIEKTVKIIKRTKKKDLSLDDFPLDDKKTFKLLKEGLTTGVFQLESAGMKRYLRELKPTRFEDIIAMVSLYRPGPMEWIPNYIKGKHDQSKITYLHPSLKPILEETHGIAVYQEQILQIAQKFAGFTLGEADILRRAIGKKKKEALKAQRDKFIKGATKEGHSKKFALDIFKKVIEPFASYGFNKSHAACYAMIAYQTAFLKANYPAEFMAALLTSDADNMDRVAIEIDECERLGINVLPPSVNESLANFTVKDDKNIRFGLNAIKGIGGNSVQSIIEARGNKKFKSLEDFAKRVPSKNLNKKTLESLAFSGALDEIGERNKIAKSTEEIVKFAKCIQDSYIQGQTDIFGMIGDDEACASLELREIPEASYFEKLKWEKDYLGMYVSSHPLDGLKKYLARRTTLLSRLTKKYIGKKVMIAGLITQMKRIMTKKGQPMMYLVFEDPTSKINVTVFPSVFEKFRPCFREDQITFMTGKIEWRRDEYQFICQEVKGISLDVLIEKAKEEKLYDENDKVVRQLKKSVLDEENSSEVVIPDSEEKKSLPFIIKVKTGIDLKILEKLKELLYQHKGNSVVEIHIPAERSLKRIKVPFFVEVTRGLKNEVSKLLEGKIQNPKC